MSRDMDSVFSKAPVALKYVTSFAVYFCNIGNAIVMGIVGPSLTSLGYKYDAEEREIAKVTTVFGISILCGATFAGFLFRRVNRQLGAVIFLTIESIGVSLLPNLPSLTMFFVVNGIVGFCAGVYNIAQIAWIIDIWRHKSGPFIQAQHFFFALGGIATPLLLRPFLVNDKPATESPTTSTVSTMKPTAKPDFYVPFVISGAILLLGALFQLVLYLIYRSQKGQRLSESSSEEPEDKIDEKKAESPSRKRIIILLFLCSICVGLLQSMEIMTQVFFSKFAQNSKVELSEAAASDASLAVQIPYAAGRVLGVYVITKVAPHILLGGNVCLVLLGGGVLFGLGRSNESWLYVGSALLGAGFSTNVPSFFAYAEKYIFINDSVTSVIMVWTGIMVSLYPLLISEFIEKVPEILIYIIFANTAVFTVAFGTLFKITYSRGSKKSEET